MGENAPHRSDQVSITGVSARVPGCTGSASASAASGFPILRRISLLDAPSAAAVDR